MNILVTGGAGFIGSHLVDALIERGELVTVIDDLSYGHREQVNPKATFIKADITDAAIESSIVDEEFDTIVHLAAQKNARFSFDDPAQDAQHNIVGTIRLLEAAHKGGVDQFLFISTGGVMYAESNVFPTPETERPTPSSPYAVSKRSAEEYLELYAREYGMRTLSLRLANVYGPRQDPKGEAGVVAIFMNALINKQPVRIYGDGEQTRDYVYVQDIVEAILAALGRIDEIPSGQYNVGTGIETSVNQLAELVVTASGLQGEIEHTDAVPGDQRRSAIESSTFERLTGWMPRTPLEHGVKQTAEWFLSQK